MRRTRLIERYASLWVLLDIIAGLLGLCGAGGASGGIDPDGVPFVWTDRQQAAFEGLQACLL